MTEPIIKHRVSIDPMTPYVPGRPIDEVKKAYNLSQVIKLASNENPLGFSPKAKEAVIACLCESNLYPDGNCTILRGVLAEYLGVQPTEIVFGCGADEVIAMAGKVFINPGDECITASITFSQYAASVSSMGGTMVYAPLKDEAYDLDAILNKITDKTKIIFLANPNNPTGIAFSAAAQEDFLKRVPPHIFVLIDEAYAEYATDSQFPNTLSMLPRYKNVMLLKTFSKIYGLASFRVGYGVADESIIRLFEKVRPPFNVTIQGQTAAWAALADQDFVRQSRENNTAALTYMYQALNKMGLQYIPSQANFIWMDSGKDSRVVFADLMKKGYIIRAGYALAPGERENYLRVTMGTPPQMAGFVQALRDVL
jgi:histidinol-phosphate aminotransferase